jgi:predicted GNAT superfamily acetyltransferase
VATIDIRILENPPDLAMVEELQRVIWPGNDMEIVPVHMLRACVHNGGLVLGAYRGESLVGFVFGFPGLEFHGSKPKLIHASHMAGVHPEFRNAGIGYKLKRAQWQVVRKQGVERITWTYDPLQSRNANLNIAKLGAVCSTYIPNYYGEMRDEINLGMPSDRFQVDWWVNSSRVRHRLMARPNQPRLAPSRYLEAGIPLLNQAQVDQSGLVLPGSILPCPENPPMLLFEIPADIQRIKRADLNLAIQWSSHLRSALPGLFGRGYIVTDFVFLPEDLPRCYYVLTNGDATF